MKSKNLLYVEYTIYRIFECNMDLQINEDGGRCVASSHASKMQLYRI